MTIDNGETPDGVEPPTYEDTTPTAPIETVQMDTVEDERDDQPIRVVHPMTRQVANGFKLAWEEMGEEILGRFSEEIATRFAAALHASSEEAQKEADQQNPEIEYRDRQHALRWVLELSVFVALFAGATYGYAVIAGNVFAPLIGVTSVSLLILLGVRISSMYLDAKPDRRESKLQRFGARFVLFVYIAALCAVFVAVMHSFGVDRLWSLGYLLLSFTLLYLSMAEHYKWSALVYRRAGSILYAERPARSRYFLPTFNRRLILLNVNTCDERQSWFEEKVLRMYRIKLTIDASMGESSSDYDSETAGMSPSQRKRHAKEQLKNARFWRDMRFIRRGHVLSAAIVQGSIMRRG